MLVVDEEVFRLLNRLKDTGGAVEVAKLNPCPNSEQPVTNVAGCHTRTHATSQQIKDDMDAVEFAILNP